MKATIENVTAAVLAGTLAVLSGMLTLVAGVLIVVAATLEVALLVVRGKLWCLIELPEISNTVTRFKTCKKCLKWPLNGTFHLKVTYFSTPGVFTNYFFSVHELS